MTTPNAPILTSPISGTIIDLLSVQRLSWTFSDPDPGDTQSAYDLRYRVVGSGSWTTVSGTTATFRDFTASTFTAGNFEWQVRTTDNTAAVGPYSSSEFFTAASAPVAPTITGPADGATVGFTQTVTWTAVTRTHYQLRRVADLAGAIDAGTIYFDSGELADPTAVSLAVTFDTSNRYEHVQVRVKADGLWSAWASILVMVTFTGPAAPTVVPTASAATGSIAFAITNPVVGGKPDAASNAVYIRAVGESGYGDRMAVGIAPNTTWTWWTPASGIDYEVRVLCTATNGSTTWSEYVYATISSGGTPSTVHTHISSGGTPTTVHTVIKSGGIP